MHVGALSFRASCDWVCARLRSRSLSSVIEFYAALLRFETQRLRLSGFEPLVLYERDFNFS